MTSLAHFVHQRCRLSPGKLHLLYVLAFFILAGITAAGVGSAIFVSDAVTKSTDGASAFHARLAGEFGIADAVEYIAAFGSAKAGSLPVRTAPNGGTYQVVWESPNPADSTVWIHCSANYSGGDFYLDTLVTIDYAPDYSNERLTAYYAALGLELKRPSAKLPTPGAVPAP